MGSTQAPRGNEGEWIVADIGGTYARFACWGAARGLDAAGAARYRNDDFSDLAALIDRYRRDQAPGATQALLALALPVGPGPLRMTNRDWTFTADGLRAALGLSRLQLVNDFVAAAAGIGDLRPDEVERIGAAAHAPATAARATKLVLGPGTGLGAAAIVSADGRERIIASEAGHMSAAPSGSDAQAACAAARARFGRASWERLLCGDGLALLEAAIRGAEPATAAEVAARALAGEPFARRAAGAFAHALGEFAGDLCLAFRATGGVYLTGGVLQGLGTALDARALRAGFEDKGRFGALLREVPCLRVRADDLALRGLARLLAGAVRAPIVEADGSAR